MVTSRRILDPVAQESYSMRHLQGLNITFLPRQSSFIQLHRRDHSPPSCPWMVSPTSLHLLIHLPGCLYKQPVLPLSWTLPLTFLSRMLCGQSGPLSMPKWFGPTVLPLNPWSLRLMSQWDREPASHDRRQHPLILPAPKFTCKRIPVTLPNPHKGALSS